MTPAERLTAAADLLDKRASEATEGPWGVYGNSDGVTAIVGGADREFGVVEDRDISPDDAHYIAAVHPEVGKALAEVLRSYAEGVRALDQILTSAPAGPGRIAMLDLADLLLAGAS